MFKPTNQKKPTPKLLQYKKLTVYKKDTKPEKSVERLIVSEACLVLILWLVLGGYFGVEGST